MIASCRKGGAFLISDSKPEECFAPEDFDAEARMIGQAAEDFVREELLTQIDRIEKAEEGLMKSLDRKMGELGFTAAETPAVYDGLDLPKPTIALIVEKLGPEPATCLTLQAHAGLAVLPLVMEGNDAQKRKYLPKLASGEWCGSFCLSEPGSGSDALGMKTRAVPAPDGKGYIVKGEKMWVTNAGFADLFTVFARMDDRISAFLIERSFPGVTLGREEEKIGLHGSSTRRVAFEDVHVPAENLLGEAGKAHYAALNTLNLGRYKMAASGLGTGKYALELGVQYALQRHQFGKPIADFGLVKQKVAQMTARLFALESMLYRIGGDMNAAFHEVHHSDVTQPSATLLYRKAASEFAAENALVKFFGTEVQHFCADESMQIHGGYGYTEDFPIAKIFRESRVPRIYEGTNEINRINVTQGLIRRMSELGLDAAISVSQASWPTGVMEMALDAASRLKAVCLSVLKEAWREYGEDLKEQRQEVAAAIADLACYALALESVALRLPKLQEKDAGEMAALIFAREAIFAAHERTDFACQAMGLRPAFFDPPNIDSIAIGRALADKSLARGGYPF